MRDFRVIEGGRDRPASRADAEAVLAAYVAFMDIMERPGFRAPPEAIGAVLGSFGSVIRLTSAYVPDGGRPLELVREIHRTA